jgi:hypothetical protein
VALSHFLQELKRDSSKWLKTQAAGLGDFCWQSGYGAFSVSPSHVDPLKRYIADQERHHQRETFQDEFRRLCRKYGVEIDERYVWDWAVCVAKNVASSLLLCNPFRVDIGAFRFPRVRCCMWKTHG